MKNKSKFFSVSFFPSEKCGVFGAFGDNMESARLVHTGLWTLQHRGQESSGIASSEGTTIRVVKDEGLVAHVYNEELLSLLSGNIAIGHNRYGTSGGAGKMHAQPVTGTKNLVALAHNGNLPSVTKIKSFLEKKGIDTTLMNDSEMMHSAIEYYMSEGLSLEESVKKSFPLFTGVFSLLLMTNNQIAALRDSKGIRPLSLAKLNGGYVFSSETCAFDALGATYIRDVMPGELVVIDSKGVHSYQIAKGDQKLDIFEFVYFSRPDSVLLGKSVNEVRKNLGRILAKENNIDGDIVIPVPDSAIPAAIGYSEQSKIPFDFGLIKNRYIHRTFIRPSQKLRERDVAMKLNPIPNLIKGKRVILIDDSIVRGTTSKKIVERILSAGAKEVHLLISSPAVLYPDFYGINTPNQDDLIASMMSIKEMTKYINVTSLHFLSYKGLLEAIGLPESKLSTSCFTGIYPVGIGERRKDIKRHPKVK
ncbi:MAG: amidophosphoribosyltransferase [bacterium]